MKAVLDACVLYPTVMREVLLGVAATGAYTPVWSDRILEEWLRATHKLGPADTEYARGEIALIRAKWPRALQPKRPEDDHIAPLPDPNDTHVLATALSSRADLIITMNLQDFPRRVLQGFGISAMHPDEFLWRLFGDDPDMLRGVTKRVQQEAERLSGTDLPIRALMKKARMPRLGKALSVD